MFLNDYCEIKNPSELLIYHIVNGLFQMTLRNGYCETKNNTIGKEPKKKQE